MQKKKKIINRNKICEYNSDKVLNLRKHKKGEKRDQY